MTNREKIIVGLMVLSVVYGVYILFFSEPQKAPTIGGDKELATLNSFIAKVADRTKTGLTSKQAYILKKAQAVWKQDPLVQIRTKSDEDEEEESKPPVLNSDLVYTGFLEMGARRLAIINGTEYEAGEKLEPGGFIIRSIRPNHVVIAPANRKTKTMIIPLEENE
ncbi:MAG: hypothetical protein HKO68_01880 [Desulfobacterales bacterium]|nr:hypothetical protein [Desulfobacterales bacterium]